MLYHFPSYHADTTKIAQISNLNAYEKKTIKATVESIKNIRTKYGKFITEAKMCDNSGIIDVIWFNQPFLTRAIKVGSQILLNGKLNPKRNKPQLYSPTYEVVRNEDATHLGIIVPVYATTEGITTKWLRARIKFLLTKHSYLLEDLLNILTHSIKKSYD